MNGFNNNGFGVQPGTIPGMGASQTVKVNPWLATDTINELRTKVEGFSLGVEPQEVARAQCNHREVNGMPSIIEGQDGSCKCTICGYEFNITEELSQQQVEAACRMIENILQTIKLMYISLDAEQGKQFFQILAFLRKVPKLWEIACEDYKRYENVYGFTQNVPPSAFAVFGSLTSPGYGFGFGQPQQPMYNQPMMMGQPGYPNNMNMGMPPAMNQGYPAGNAAPYGAPQMGNPFVNGFNGQPQQPMGQPMMMNQPGYPQQPVMNQQPQQGFAMNPTGAAAPVQEQPAQAPVVDANAPVKVDGNFSA